MKITIVTITFNAERAIQRTLDSVAMQTYDDIEHLIIDGVSKDGTLSIVNRYKSESKHDVKVTSEPDKGLYDAMNKGLARATGDYLVFLNAGDTLPETETIKTIADAALKHPNAAVIYGDTAITDPDGNFLHLRTHRPPEVLTWRSFKKGMLVCHQAFYVNVSLGRNIQYNLKYRHSSDVDWCIRVMKEADHRGMPLVNTHRVLANFEEGGNTTQHHLDSLKERFWVMSDHYGFLPTVLVHIGKMLHLC